MKKTVIIILVIVVALEIIYGAWRFFTNKPEQAFCTLEAKQCPDGSYVGRSGPKCEFAKCPEMSTAGWKTATDPELGVSFKYPQEFYTTYLRAVDWPPKVQIVDSPFTCTEAGSETARAGETQRQIIGDRVYCVTKEIQGAAGSIYAQYAYATSYESNKVIILTFSIQFPQCVNYDEPRREECQIEQANFRIEGIIDRIFSTLIYV